MMRSILLNGKGNAVTKTIKFLRFISIQENVPSLEQSVPTGENLYVRLCGTISKNPYKSPNGSFFLPLKTRNVHDEFQTEHHIYGSSAVLKTFSVDQLTKGQRVYVVGRIGYNEVETADGYLTQEAQIYSHAMLRCPQDDDLASDINQVKLYGHVKSKPHIDDIVTSMVVATKYFNPKEQRYKSRLHEVVMTEDDKIREQVNRLDVGANIFLHGYLKSEHFRNHKGNLRVSCFIRPTKLIVCQPAITDFELDDYWQ